MIPKEEKIFIRCTCGCNVIELQYWADDKIYFLNSYASSFNNAQDGVWARVKGRLKAVWNILFHEHSFYEIVISPEDANLLAKFIDETSNA